MQFAPTSIQRNISLKTSTNINPPKPVDVARKLPSSKNCTARSVHHLDALWINANLPWEKQAPFFWRQLLYMLEDEIWRAICSDDHFLKCMFSTWKTKNKSVPQLNPQFFFKRIQIVIFDTWYATFLTWKSDRNSDILMPAAAQKLATQFWKLILSQWNTGQLQGRLWSLDCLAK